MGAGAFQLKTNETVIHPMPFVPTDPYRLIITTQRVVHIDKKRIEIPAGKISFTGRTSDRPYQTLCILVAVIGLTCAILGLIFKFTAGPTGAPDPGPPKVTVNGKKDGPPAEFKYQPLLWQTAKTKYDESQSNKMKGFAGIGMLIVAGGSLVLVKKLWAKAFYVIISAGPGQSAKIKTKSEQEQSQLLTTIQSASQAAKMMGG